MPEMPEISHELLNKTFKRNLTRRLNKLEEEVNLLRVEVVQLRSIVKETVGLWNDLGFLDPACKEPPDKA